MSLLLEFHGCQVALIDSSSVGSKNSAQGCGQCFRTGFSSPLTELLQPGSPPPSHSHMFSWPCAQGPIIDGSCSTPDSERNMTREQEEWGSAGCLAWPSLAFSVALVFPHGLDLWLLPLRVIHNDLMRLLTCHSFLPGPASLAISSWGPGGSTTLYVSLRVQISHDTW